MPSPMRRPPVDHPHGGDNTPQRNRLRDALWGQDVLEERSSWAFPMWTGQMAAPPTPAKAAGLHLGDRVVCIGETATENNDAVKAALDAAQGAKWRSSISAAGNSCKPP